MPEKILYQINSKITNIKVGLWILILSATIRNAINVISLLIVGTTFPFIGALCNYITIIATALMLLRMLSSQYKIMILSLAVFSALWYMSYIQDPWLEPFLVENMPTFFLEALPYLWIFNYLVKYSCNSQGENVAFFEIFRICRVKLIIAFITQLIMFVFPHTDIFKDYMDAANALLLGLLMITAYNKISHHKNRFNTLLEFGTILMILILGSRGGVLCYISLYLFFFLFKTSNSEKLLILPMIAVAFAVLYIAFPAMVDIMGLSDNRIIVKLLSGTLFHDEERSLIFSILLRETKGHPLGLGIMADRSILTSSTEVWDVFYAHNIQLELYVNFGYLGLLFVLILFMLLYKAIQRPSGYDRYILFVFISCSFIKLQVSSSLWVDPIFWGMIGVALGILSYNPFRPRQNKISKLN